VYSGYKAQFNIDKLKKKKDKEMVASTRKLTSYQEMVQDGDYEVKNEGIPINSKQAFNSMFN